jgi:hypothetical protein
MRYLVDPQLLVFNSKGRIAGFSELLSQFNIPQWDILNTAMEVVSRWSEDWPDGCGFGSSDMTYLMKEFIDEVIVESGNGGVYMTKFTPSLSVVEYSEADTDNLRLRMEQGI